MKPNYHVVPWRNWCNDPNGLIYDGELYHAFYQHYPDDHAWGPMHWGHSTSRDLYRWDHQPIALFPDKHGYCFSGSAIIDDRNSSGLKKDGKAPMLLFYTSHPDIAADDGKFYEQQSMAYSYDGVHFTPYEGNPILENNGHPDFRDPKVFYHDESQHWIMVLAAFDHIAFYKSKNCIDWVHSGDFGPGENTISGVWECPDLFALDLEGKKHWILIVSMGTSEDEGRAVTQYFVGEFDGLTFKSSKESDESRLIDYGPDNYAAVSFFGSSKRLLMGWALNWGYSASTPTEGWVGQMTAPRELSLFRDLEGRISLASNPVSLPDEIIESRTVHSGNSIIQLSTESVQINFDINSNSPEFEIEFRNEANNSLVIKSDNDRKITVDRSKSGQLNFHEMLKLENFLKRTVKPISKSTGHFTLMLDGPLLEVYADNGSRVISMVVYPKTPYTHVEISGHQSFEISQLKQHIPVEANDYYVNQK